jgi:hypothetical protein
MLRKLLQTVANRISRAVDRPLPPATPEAERRARALREGMAAIDLDQLQRDTDITDRWKWHLGRLLRASAEKDPREFLRWPETGPILFEQGVLPYFLRLRMSRRWASRWKQALVEPPLGHPRPFFLYPSVGCSIIQHAYHLHAIEQFTGEPPEAHRTVVELGGGFGSMCHLVHRLGFQGLYVVFDLPPLHQLQAYYLDMAGVPLITVDEALDGGNGVLQVTDPEVLRRLLPADESARRPRLFIATWSLSECPVDLRQTMGDLVINGSDTVLIAFQPSFEDIDNPAYFRGWSEQHGDEFETLIKPIPFRSWDHYLFARRRSAASST